MVDSPFSPTSPSPHTHHAHFTTPHAHPAHLTTVIDTSSSEVEVQVLQTGTSSLTNTHPAAIPPASPRTKRVRGRNSTKTSARQRKSSKYKEQKVISDGEFEVPLTEEQVVIATPDLPAVESSVDSHTTRVETSEAAENLAFLSLHITSLASGDTNEEHIEPFMTSAEVTETVETCSGPALVPSSEPANTGSTAPENMSGEIVAVAEVIPTVQDADSSVGSVVLDKGGTAIVTQVTESDTNISQHLSRETDTSRDETTAGNRDSILPTDESRDKDPEPVRRSRRKITRVRRLVSSESNSPPQEQGAIRSPKKSPLRKRAATVKKNQVSSSLEDTPPTKRTRRTNLLSERGEEEMAEARHPLEWGVDEVVAFVGTIPQCACLTDAFRDHVSLYLSTLLYIP